jgi:hypothetical protein
MTDDEPERPAQAQAIPKALLEAADEFHMWIGMCISLWATIEARIFRICWKSLGCSEERAAIVYFRTPSLDTRMALTQELVESVLPKTAAGQPLHPDLSAWNEIVRTFHDLKRVRNRIAHHPVTHKTEPGALAMFPPLGGLPFDPNEMDYWFENYVSQEERLRGRHTQMLPLGIEDLKAHYLATFGLTKQLDAFLEGRLPPYL